MPQVKMNANAAGPDWSASKGKTITLGDKEAKTLVDGGYAEYVGEPTRDTKDKAPAKGKGKGKGSQKGQEGGVNDESKDDNPPDDGAPDADGSENASEG